MSKAKTIQDYFERNEGILRLLPNLKAYKFSKPGYRLRLHPYDYYGYGYGYPGYGYEPGYAYAPGYAYTPAPVVTGRSVATGAFGNYCSAPARTCLLKHASNIGSGCACRVSGGYSHGHVTH